MQELAAATRPEEVRHGYRDRDRKGEEAFREERQPARRTTEDESPLLREVMAALGFNIKRVRFSMMAIIPNSRPLSSITASCSAGPRYRWY